MRFRVVHPFHPLTGQDFEFVNFGHTWGDQKVWYRKPGEQRSRSMPTSWTDLAAVDAYVALSSGRSFFRPDDLLALAGMLRQMQESGVSEIMP